MCIHAWKLPCHHIHFSHFLWCQYINFRWLRWMQFAWVISLVSCGVCVCVWVDWVCSCLHSLCLILCLGVSRKEVLCWSLTQSWAMMWAQRRTKTQFIYENPYQTKTPHQLHTILKSSTFWVIHLFALCWRVRWEYWDSYLSLAKRLEKGETA